MTTIYRVQDLTGRGPFKPGFSEKWVQEEDKPHWKTLKPWMEEFGTWNILQQVRLHEYAGCGCESIEQLKLWISERELVILRIFGYCAVQMEVERILGRSKIQLVFARNRPLYEGVIPVEIYEPQTGTQHRCSTDRDHAVLDSHRQSNEP